MTINYPALVRPFPPDEIELRAGATSKDKTRALALAYADPRTYQDRLDEVVGIEQWSDDYVPVPTTASTVALLCRLTIAGVTKCDIGESPASDPNAWTVAAAQAFKRACAKFGIGRYLYHLPQVWLPYDERTKQITEQQQAVLNIYRQAGITPAMWRGVSQQTVPEPDARVQAAEATFWETFEEALGGREWAQVVHLVGEVPYATTIEAWRSAYRKVRDALTQGEQTP